MFGFIEKVFIMLLAVSRSSGHMAKVSNRKKMHFFE